MDDGMVQQAKIMHGEYPLRKTRASVSMQNGLNCIGQLVSSWQSQNFDPGHLLGARVKHFNFAERI